MLSLQLKADMGKNNRFCPILHYWWSNILFLKITQHFRCLSCIIPDHPKRSDLHWALEVYWIGTFTWNWQNKPVYVHGHKSKCIKLHTALLSNFILYQWHRGSSTSSSRYQKQSHNFFAYATRFFSLLLPYSQELPSNFCISTSV